MNIEEIILNKRPDLKGSDDKINRTELNRLILSKDKEIKQILKQEEMFLDEDQDFDWGLAKDYFFKKEHIKGSFTKYDNKIGLAINEINDVVLNFPYKDCIFVGGMDKEDSNIGAESFYNEIIDKDKIYQMFAPKAFDNIKKISVLKEEVLEHQVKSFFEDGKLKESLLIKGNNLLGLYSLKEKMKNKIDVIYIDPPYYFNEKKSADSFAYNSNFKLSTWLVFMKNRLEIAKELLSNTGIIFISIDEDGQDYLKLLCDDIFGVNNYLGDIIWDKRNPKGNVKHLSILTENIICYSKNKENPLTANKLLNKKNGLDKVYKKRDELFDKFKNNKKTLKEINTEFNSFISKLDIKEGLKAYKHIDDNGNIYRGVSIDSPAKSNNKYEVNHPITKQACKIPSNGWRLKEEEFKKLVDKNLILFGINENTIPNKKQYLKDYEKEIMTNLFSYAGSGLSDLEELSMNKHLFQNPKPLKLLNYLLEHTDKDAIVLDFFAGSGTTGHAVMDLNKEDGGNRKFILLEQMNYIENITKERLIRAIQKNEYNEDFVYMELKENINKKVKNDIKSLSTIQELKNIIESSFDFGIFTNTLILKEDLLKEIEELDIKSAKRLVLEKYIDNTNDYVQYHNYTVLDDNEKFYN